MSWCMQNVAGSFTEQEFAQNLSVLTNSDVWTSSPQLQRYVQRQWIDNGKYEVVYSIMIHTHISCKWHDCCTSLFPLNMLIHNNRHIA